MFFKTNTHCLTCWVHWVFHWYSQEEGAQLPSRFLFSPFLLTDNTAFLSFKSSLRALRRHLALFLFFTVVSSLSHNLFQTLPKSYSQSTCLNRHGLWRYTSFLFIETGPLPGDISESCAVLCNVAFLSFSAIICWLKYIYRAVAKSRLIGTICCTRCLSTQHGRKTVSFSIFWIFYKDILTFQFSLVQQFYYHNDSLRRWLSSSSFTADS